MVDGAHVEELLRADNRPFERIDAGTWRSSFHAESKSFRFFVRLTESWIFFTIVPFISAPKNPAAAHRLHARLLKLNRDINMAKFALDEDGDVVLTVELPTENLDASEFRDAMDALSFYADRHYVEVARIAQED